MSPSQRLLNVREVARLLRVSRNTVYNMLRRGDLPSLQVRNMWRVRYRAVRKYMRLHGRRFQRPRSTDHGKVRTK